MTKREKKLEMLSAYLDGEATEQEREVVEILLQTDTEAQAIYNDFQGMGDELSSLPVDSPIMDLKAAVCETLEREALFNGIPNEPRLASWQIYGAAAAFALAVGAGWYGLPALMSPGNPPTNERNINNYVAVAPSKDSSKAKNSASLNTETVTREGSNSGSSASGSTDQIQNPNEPYDVMAGLLPNGGSPVAGSGVIISKPRSGTLDEKLVAGRLEASEVRTAAVDAFSNQIVVDLKHASDRWMMEDALEAELYRNGTPRLGPTSAKTPLGCDEPFFVQTHPDSQSDAPFESTSFALNVAPEDAEGLLAGFNDVSSDTGIDAQITVNGVMLGQRPPPSAALSNCVAFRNGAKLDPAITDYEYDSAAWTRSTAGVPEFEPSDHPINPLRTDEEKGKIDNSKLAKTTTNRVVQANDEGPDLCRNLMVCISLRSPAENRADASSSSAPVPSTQPARHRKPSE